MLVLLDADMLCYRACASVEHEIDWGHDIWTLHVDLNEAKAKLEDMTEMILTRGLDAMHFDGDYKVIFCFSSKHNFRKDLLSTYKLNRATKRKPVGYHALVKYVEDTYIALTMDGLEADDCIGILATQPENKDHSLIISGDKDLKCIAGYHYDFLRDEFSHVNDDEAYRHFLLQALMGDATDGYTGCPKIGKVTAGKILDKDCSWKAVVGAYEKAGLSEAVALTQARVAKILTATDYDLEAKKVKLWTPNITTGA